MLPLLLLWAGEPLLELIDGHGLVVLIAVLISGRIQLMGEGVLDLTQHRALWRRASWPVYCWRTHAASTVVRAKLVGCKTRLRLLIGRAHV